MRNRYLTAISVLWAGVLIMGLITATVSAAPVAQTNLLSNPSFESGFSGGVASSWIKWAADTEPVYKQALSSVDATRVHDGSSAQQMEASHFDYVAGLQQTVSGLTVGKTYKFSAYAHAWASSDDVSTTSDGTITLRVGIGQGSTYAADPAITWSIAQAYVNSYGLLSVEAVAQNTSLTVFTHADATASFKHNDTYFDNASLIEVGAATSVAPEATQSTEVSTQLIAPTDFPLPTPDDSGQIVYYVLPGDNLVHIATIACGETPECLAKIKQLNGITGSGSIIYPGQKLILGSVETAMSSPTVDPEAEVTPEPGEIEATLDEAPSPTEASSDMVSESEPESETGTPDTDDTPVVQEEASGEICVTLYDDLNGNGVLDSGEGLVNGGVFTLVDMSSGQALDGYTTDAESEPYCFSGLVSGNYRVAAESPEGFTPTTRTDWDLTLAGGSKANLEFGAQLTGESELLAEAIETTAPLRPAILGTVGVVLMLSAAGIAGYLVLTRRR